MDSIGQIYAAEIIVGNLVWIAGRLRIQDIPKCGDDIAGKADGVLVDKTASGHLGDDSPLIPGATLYPLTGCPLPVSSGVVEVVGPVRPAD